MVANTSTIIIINDLSITLKITMIFIWIYLSTLNSPKLDRSIELSVSNEHLYEVEWRIQEYKQIVRGVYPTDSCIWEPGQIPYVAHCMFEGNECDYLGVTCFVIDP